MTIAVGLLCSDGVVIAADREEGDGYFKHDVGKIRATFRGRSPVGQIAIAGAGSGPYIDEVSKLLTDEFCEEQSGRAELLKKHREYYKGVVRPMAVYGTNAPDYGLIVGTTGGNTGTNIYSTSGLAFNEIQDYEAIGVGAMVANSWFSRLFDRVPVKWGVILAAYVVFQVKQSVPGCGHGTDILILSNNPAPFPSRVLPQGVRKWEELFSTKLRVLDRELFHHVIGLNMDPRYLLRTQIGKEALEQRVEDVRKEFTPSTPQTSEDQQ
jgi:20S proteasome alpha/beta subunit